MFQSVLWGSRGSLQPLLELFRTLTPNAPRGLPQTWSFEFLLFMQKTRGYSNHSNLYSTFNPNRTESTPRRVTPLRGDPLEFRLIMSFRYTLLLLPPCGLIVSTGSNLGCETGREYRSAYEVHPPPSPHAAPSGHSSPSYTSFRSTPTGSTPVISKPGRSPRRRREDPFQLQVSGGYARTAEGPVGSILGTLEKGLVRRTRRLSEGLRVVQVGSYPRSLL